MSVELLKWQTQHFMAKYISNSCLYMLHVHLDFSSTASNWARLFKSNPNAFLACFYPDQNLEMHSYLVRRINWSLTVLPALLLLPPSFSTCLLVSSYLHVSLNCDSLVSLQNGEGYSLSFIHLKLKLSLGLRYSSLSNSFFWNKVETLK